MRCGLAPRRPAPVRRPPLPVRRLPESGGRLRPVQRHNHSGPRLCHRAQPRIHSSPPPGRRGLGFVTRQAQRPISSFPRATSQALWLTSRGLAAMSEAQPTARQGGQSGQRQSGQRQSGQAGQRQSGQRQSGQVGQGRGRSGQGRSGRGRSGQSGQRQAGRVGRRQSGQRGSAACHLRPPGLRTHSADRWSGADRGPAP